MSDPIVFRRRVHPAAVASFLLGLASVFLFVLTGLPALWLGLYGLRAVNHSEGQMRGARLALAGMVLGGAGTFFTLLGVCAIVVIHLRGMSNRVESINNLRQIGVSLNKYADAHDNFPPATHDPQALPPDQRLSWMADVLPLLGEGSARNVIYRDLAKQIDRTKGWADPANAAGRETSVRVFVCRGHPNSDPPPAVGRTDYVGMAGINPRAAYLPRDDPRAGMFGHDCGVKRREVTGGISFTMMVLETAHANGPWLAGGFPSVRGLDPDVQHYSGPDRPFGGLQAHQINILFVDGSVKTWADSTPGEVFRAQATLQRREAKP